MSRNPHWARDFASAIKRVSHEQANAGMPLIEVALVTKRKPTVMVQPEGSEVTYQADDITWGIDPSTLKVGDAVLLVRDTGDLPVVLAVLDGDNPDPTEHVKGKALVRTVNSIQQQARFWKSPVSTLTGLSSTTTDADGTVRLNLDEDKLYRWKASTDSWVLISGGGGGGASAFADLTGSLAAAQVVDGSLPLSKLAVDPLARANHTGTQAQSTVTNLVSDLALKAPLASPTFTGTVTVAGLTGGAGAVNLTGSTTVTVPTVAIGAGSNAATIGAVNTALGSYLTSAAAASTYLPLTGGALSGEVAFVLTSAYGEKSIRSRQTGDTYDRLRVWGDGYIEWGDGASEVDTFLYRSAAGVLKVDTGTKLQQNASPTVGDDLTNKTYVDDGSYLTGFSGDISLVNGWSITVNGNAGYFTMQEGADFFVKSPTNQASYNADGLSIGDATAFDWAMSRVSAGVMALDAGSKLQQSEAPTTGGDLTNMTYVDGVADQLRRRAFFGL